MPAGGRGGEAAHRRPIRKRYQEKRVAEVISVQPREGGRRPQDDYTGRAQRVTFS